MGKQLGSKLGVGQLDQRRGALTDGLSKQVGNAKFGDHIVHIGAGDCGGLTGQQAGANAGGISILSGRCHADDGLATGRARGTPQKFTLVTYATVKVAIKLVNAHLAGQVHRKRLGNRHHFVLGRNGDGVANGVGGAEVKKRVLVDAVIQGPRAQGLAGHHFEALLCLAGPGQATGVQQGQDGVGDQIRMYAQVFAVS